MSFLAQVFGWFTTEANWTGPQGIPLLFWHQLTLSFAVVVTAIALGGGLGVVLGHTGRGGLVAVNAANAFRAVPTLALLTLLAIQPAISLKWNGFLAAWLALTALAIPPILTNTYVGMREVDADVRDAAKAMGLTGGQVLRTVEAPLALPFVMAGVRTACIEVVATSTLAAYVSYADLGTYVITGLEHPRLRSGLQRRSTGGGHGRAGGAGARPADQGFDTSSPAAPGSGRGPPAAVDCWPRPTLSGTPYLQMLIGIGQDFASPDHPLRLRCVLPTRRPSDEQAGNPTCASRVHSPSEPWLCWPPRWPSRPRRRPPRATSPPS